MSRFGVVVEVVALALGGLLTTAGMAALVVAALLEFLSNIGTVNLPRLFL
jgi:hypothetical protein